MNPHDRPELSLSTAQQMHVGQTKRDELVQRLGKPDRIIDLSLTNLGGNGTIWAYFAGGDQSAGRLSFSFSANSDTVDSISFDVRDGDPEQNLEKALSRFKGANFVKTRPQKWDNPHSSPDEVFYQDSKTGLTVVYLQSPKQVVAISWWSPSRVTTSEPETTAAALSPYCIVGLCASQPNQR